MTEQPLGGQRQGISRIGTNVHRPASTASSLIHILLQKLTLEGFDAAPRPVGFDEDGREILTFVEGRVANDPVPDALWGDEALTSAARLLARYHRAAYRVLEQSAALQSGDWNLPSIEPVETICHGDFAPYNTAFRGGEAVGMIDFDTAHPAPRVWDLAYSLYRFVPIGFHQENRTLPVEEQLRRVGLFSAEYSNRPLSGSISEWMTRRLSALVDHMKSEATAGDRRFVANLADGHDDLYTRDIRFIEEQAHQIDEAFNSRASS